MNLPASAACTILFALLLASVVPQDPTARELARRLESRYHGAVTLRAEFLERYSEGKRSVHVESGRVYFRRPGEMRWEYEAPEKKLFIADGKFVWFYVPADRTVSRARAKESSDWRTPLGLLTGKANLSRLCESIGVVPRASNQKMGQETGHTVLRCTPRGQKRDSHSGLSAADGPSPDVDFDEVLLEVDDATADLASILVRQAGGVDIEYRFAGWQRNPKLSKEFFQFVIPAGVTIVDESSLHPTQPGNP